MNPLQESIYSVLEAIAKEEALDIRVECKTGDNSFMIKFGEEVFDIYPNGDIVIIKKEDNKETYWEWSIDYILEHGIRSIL